MGERRIEAEEREEGEGGRMERGKDKDTHLKSQQPHQVSLLGKRIFCQVQVYEENEGLTTGSTLAPSLTGAEVPGTSLGHFRCSVTKNRFQF